MAPSKTHPARRKQHIPLLSIRNAPVQGIFVKPLGMKGPDTPHRDDYYIIIFISSGRASGSVDFDEISLVADEAFIISPAQIHFPGSTHDDAEGWLLAMAPEHFTADEAALIARYALHPVPVTFAEVTARDLSALFGMLSRHYSEPTVALPLALAVKSIVLSAMITENPSEPDRYTALTLRLQEMLAQNLQKEKSPSAYADMLHVSEVYLNEAVKAATGRSAGSFIRGNAVLQAKRLLAYTSLSALEVAAHLGYDDYPYFSKLFKKETGMSPVEYRKTLNSTSIT